MNSVTNILLTSAGAVILALVFVRYLRDYFKGDKTFGTIQHPFKSWFVVDCDAFDADARPPWAAPDSFNGWTNYDAVAYRYFYFNAAHGICAHLSAANGYGI